MHADLQPRTAWSLFNPFTEQLKGMITDLARRTQALHGLLDEVCGVIRPGAAPALDGVDERDVVVTVAA